MKKFINTSNGGQSKRNGNLIVTKKCNFWVWTKFTSFLFAVRTSTVVTKFKKWAFLLNDDNSKLWAGGKVLHFLLFRTKNSTTISSELAFFLHFFGPWETTSRYVNPSLFKVAVIVNKVYCGCRKWFRKAGKFKFPIHPWWFLKKCPCCVIYIGKWRLW